MRPLSRRDLLRVAALGAVGLLAACRRDRPPRNDPPATQSLEQIQGQRSQSIQLIPAGTELIAERPERLAFGVLDPTTNRLIPDAAVQVWVARDRTSPALGPFTAVFRGEGLGDRGVYVAGVNFPSTGKWLVLATARVGQAEEQIGAGEIDVGVRNAMPKIGDPAISVHTPTENAARGVDPICTRKPPCPLHKVSLADALSEKRPIVLIFATPAFCQSRLCGPEVDIVQAIAEEFDDRATFIHVEVFRDDEPETIQRQIVSPPAAAWKVVEEPAVYYIDRAGVVKHRQLGPVDRADVRIATETLLA